MLRSWSSLALLSCKNKQQQQQQQQHKEALQSVQLV
jgi:hypothetical protein